MKKKEHNNTSRYKSVQGRPKTTPCGRRVLESREANVVGNTTVGFKKTKVSLGSWTRFQILVEESKHVSSHHHVWSVRCAFSLLQPFPKVPVICSRVLHRRSGLVCVAFRCPSRLRNNHLYAHMVKYQVLYIRGIIMDNGVDWVFAYKFVFTFIFTVYFIVKLLINSL